MRIFLCLLGHLNADWYGELGLSQSGPSWDEWSNWSPCTDPCGAEGTHIRSRQCRNGDIGEGSCKGDQAETASCSAECFGTCATNYQAANGAPVEVALDAAPKEVCFWSTSHSSEASGVLVTYDSVSYSRAANGQFQLQIVDMDHFIPAGKDHAHTCIVFGDHAIKVQQDGMMRFYPANGYAQTSRTLVIGGGTFDGSVSELAVSADEQDPMIRLAQSAGSACNLDTVANINDHTLAGAWSDWGSCSHNCGNGRSYRYRESGNDIIQMFRECNPQPCQPGWTDWSQWTPCDASCGGGSSHRTRSCSGPSKCEGAPHEKKPCNGPDCPACGYSAWQFPMEQSIANYLMVKPVLTDFSSVSVCFAVENGMDQLHGTVFSYSRGLDSPRGNELLFLGKDIGNDEIRLYRRDEKISIPNTVLVPGEKANFCITLQAYGTKLHTAVYVNGFIAASSSEGSVRNGVALPGGGEMIIGQDQDCILGCFNSSQALVGNLYDFSIYDFALNPEEVMNLHLDGSCARQPVLMLSKDNTMVYGKPKFTSSWAEFGEWSECSAQCGEGHRQRVRACLGGRPNDSGCPGSNIEKMACDSGVACDATSEWSECSVKCGGYGTRTRLADGVVEEEECGGRACPEVGDWSAWSECSRTCGDGFIYRYRECYNGPCEQATQETSWCNEAVCVDSWNMPWPCGEVRQASKTVRIVGGYEAQRAEVPWVCILELRSDPICGASVIAPKWNIGASHCVSQTFDRPEQMRILCGVHDRTITEYGSQTGQVVQYYKHPKYSGSTIDYDLCLFEMKDAWQFTDYVKPVCLPGLHQFPKPGTLCKVAGWGSTHPVAPGHFLWHVEMARSLRAVHVPIIEQAQCAAKYKDQITRRMFCAGYDEGGRDACQVRR
jgi:trypsin